MRRRLLIFLLVGLIATGCMEDPPKSGTVLAKYHREQYQQWVNGHMQCASYGKYGCTVWYSTPGYWDIRCKGGCYWLRLQDCNEDGECREGDRRVNAITWSQYEIGDFYEGH